MAEKSPQLPNEIWQEIIRIRISTDLHALLAERGLSTLAGPVATASLTMKESRIHTCHQQLSYNLRSIARTSSTLAGVVQHVSSRLCKTLIQDYALFFIDYIFMVFTQMTNPPQTHVLFKLSPRPPSYSKPRCYLMIKPYELAMDVLFTTSRLVTDLGGRADPPLPELIELMKKRNQGRSRLLVSSHWAAKWKEGQIPADVIMQI